MNISENKSVITTVYCSTSFLRNLTNKQLYYGVFTANTSRAYQTNDDKESFREFHHNFTLQLKFPL